MKLETEFQPGDKCIYHEGGNIVECKILERPASDDYTHLHFILDPFKTIQENPLAKPIQIGVSFLVFKKLRDNEQEPWHIEEVPNLVH